MVTQPETQFMFSFAKKIARIPWIAEKRRTWRIRSDAKREAKNWTLQDERMLEFYSQFLKPDDLCFDIGANVGNRLKVFRKIGAKIIGVEPQRECANALRKWYADDPKVTILEMALSHAKGKAELMTSNFHMISSLSQEWVNATKESGRFATHRWTPAGTVDLTTMDALIAEYGLPRFAKIDVEGFELNVVKGLSQPLAFLSLEFTPETRQSSIDCLSHLEGLGEPIFNFSDGESMKLRFHEWLSFAEIIQFLESVGTSNEIWGDIYIAFPQAQ
jgi:FkbM family methyltransferase